MKLPFITRWVLPALWLVLAIPLVFLLVLKPLAFIVTFVIIMLILFILNEKYGELVATQ